MQKLTPTLVASSLSPIDLAAILNVLIHFEFAEIATEAMISLAFPAVYEQREHAEARVGMMLGPVPHDSFRMAARTSICITPQPRSGHNGCSSRHFFVLSISPDQVP